MPHFKLPSYVTNYFSRLTAVAIMAVLCAGGAFAAPVLQVVSGKLTGANGVVVGANLYDVEFVDGSCAALYSGCDSNLDFTFQTSSAADDASQALLDQVFVDGVQGNFDSSPELTAGCSGVGFCIVSTPYSLFINFLGLVIDSSVANIAGSSFDFVQSELFPLDFDRASENESVFAVWKVARAEEIPEPTSLALFGVAGAAMAWSQRRRRTRGVPSSAQ